MFMSTNETNKKSSSFVKQEVNCDNEVATGQVPVHLYDLGYRSCSMDFVVRKNPYLNSI